MERLAGEKMGTEAAKDLIIPEAAWTDLGARASFGSLWRIRTIRHGCMEQPVDNDAFNQHGNFQSSLCST